MAKQVSNKTARYSRDEKRRKLSQIVLAVISIMLVLVWIITLIYR